MKRNTRLNGGPSGLATIIRQRRQILNLSQAEIAEKLAVSEVAIGFWECGKRAIDLDRVPLLAEVLGMDPTSLSVLALSEAYPRLFCYLAAALPALGKATKRRKPVGKIV